MTLVHVNFVFPFASDFNSYFGNKNFRVEQFMVTRPGNGPDNSHCLDKGFRKGMQVGVRLLDTLSCLCFVPHCSSADI
jgi:hypothetical protein